MIAVSALISLRPETAAPGVALTLERASDPATLMWLLCLLQKQGAATELVVDYCQDALEALARGPLLTVRALARRLLVHPESVPMGPSDPEVLRSPGRLWTSFEREVTQHDRAVEQLVQEVAGTRLHDAEELQPGLLRTVRADVSRQLSSDRMRKRLGTQLRAYQGVGEQREPDAYVSAEEAVETAVQTAAAGSRAHRFAVGLGTSDPGPWEDQLATALTDDPSIPLSFEGVRWPRPDLLLPSGPDESSGPGSSIGSADRGFAGTVSVRPLAEADVLAGLPVTGWRIFGSVERRRFLAAHSREIESVSLRFSGPEVKGSECSEEMPPFSVGRFEEWAEVPERFLPAPPRGSDPLLGVDRDMATAGDGGIGLGLPDLTLAPTQWLRAVLRLRPGGPLILEDEHGPALRLICWRAEYVRSSYHLPWPRTTGCAVIVRPDLLDVLSALAPAPIVIRDFVMHLGAG